MGILEGKKGIIYGIRNERSLCWGCAQSIAREGGQLLLTYLGEREEKDVRKLARTLPNAESVIIQSCDLTDAEDVAKLHRLAAESFGSLDFVIHGAAFATKEDLSGRFVDTSRDGFLLALEISSYSLTVAAKAAEPLMSAGGSIFTLTYLGSEKVVPNYNVMGVAKAALEATARYLAFDLGPKKIRVNTVSAGPVKTLSAMAVGGIDEMFTHTEKKAPLKRNIDADEVGKTAVYLLSDLSSGVTGENIFVDSGFNIVGL